jgi:hypothetical protein
MALRRRHCCHGDGFDGLERQGRIAAETPMFGSHLACPVAKLPWWISQNGAIGALAHLAQKVLGWSRGMTHAASFAQGSSRKYQR